MLYAIACVTAIFALAVLQMRLLEGGYFLERLVQTYVLLALGLVCLIFLLAFWSTPYPKRFAFGGPATSYLLVFAVAPAVAASIIAFPEMCQHGIGDDATLRWAQGGGWLLLLALVLAAVVRWGTYIWSNFTVP